MSARERLLLSLEELGWAVSDDLVPTEFPANLFPECQALWQAGHFHPAQIGRGIHQARLADIRGDSICWLQTESPSVAIQLFLSWADDLRRELNQRFFLGLKHGEFHFARYPEGRGYKKHLDQHRDNPSRQISLTLYLNPQWPSDSGGELCLYSVESDPQEIKRILPQPGRLVIFRSDIVPHEVLPCSQTRWSLTGWFRTDSLVLPG